VQFVVELLEEEIFSPRDMEEEHMIHAFKESVLDQAKTGQSNA
jgi:hypothetical protein